MNPRFFLGLFLTIVMATPVFGRGGGGCLEEGTHIATPGGEVPIERLVAGDVVLTGQTGRRQSAVVRACTTVEPTEYIELVFGGRRLRATPEHPVEIALGVFRMASQLAAGDVVRLGSGFHAVRLQAVRHIRAERPAYNLMVHPSGTYLANGVAVHNKGCFLPDTPILRADGTMAAIREVRPGDALLAFSMEGNITQAVIREIITLQVDEYVEVTTDRIVLRVTPEHPFYVGNGTFKTLAALKMGDSVFAYDGTGLSLQRILAIRHIRAPTTVYNLRTDAPHTFFANGIAVHNKGCFPAGARVLTPQGEVPIEQLGRGDPVVAIDEHGRSVSTTVVALYATRSPLLLLETDLGILRVTSEHPLQAEDGTFRAAGETQAGNRIMAWRNGRLQPATVHHCRVLNEKAPVYNLQVGVPHTFVVDGFMVHNKGGGCFPSGTHIRTVAGDVPIENLLPGQTVLSVDDDGRLVQTRVKTLHATRSPVLVLETESGPLRTTVEHPLRLPEGGFGMAGELGAGASILVWQNERLQPTRILGQHLSAQEETVFNLTVDWPHTFIADGFVVHNKGGGGSHGSHSRGSGGNADPAVATFVAFLFFTIIVINSIYNWKKSKDEDLDFLYKRPVIDRKSEKTRKLLEFIARIDPGCNLQTLQEMTRTTFLQLQKCWQARDYTPMRPLMMPNLYSLHCSQIRGMLRNHEINVMEGLRVEAVDIVSLRYPQKENQREFAALITASMRDYYLDDRDRKFLRGDDGPSRFQEFWTFQRQDGKWFLREIEQTRESDVLKEENFFEPFTDQGVEQVYGDAAGQTGEAGPWLEKDVGAKASRIDRLLIFLAQTDSPIWNHQRMTERTREVFLNVMLAWEAGDPGAVPSARLFPDLAAALREGIAGLRNEGKVVEYRNLCVRKVELVLVRNFADDQLDEFTARVSAHAQRIVKQNDRVISQDEYVSPWEEYWTFGRLDNEWKLKEILPPAKGEQLVAQENLDQDSSPGQLQWYYRQSRAG